MQCIIFQYGLQVTHPFKCLHESCSHVASTANILSSFTEGIIFQMQVMNGKAQTKPSANRVTAQWNKTRTALQTCECNTEVIFAS